MVVWRELGFLPVALSGIYRAWTVPVLPFPLSYRHLTQVRTKSFIHNLYSFSSLSLSQSACLSVYLPACLPVCLSVFIPFPSVMCEMTDDG